MAKRRWRSGLLLALFLICALASSACLAREASHPHDCRGEDCPVCRLLAQIETLRRGFALALAALALRLFPALCPEGRVREAARLPHWTPVGRRIRLND